MNSPLLFPDAVGPCGLWCDNAILSIEAATLEGLPLQSASFYLAWRRENALIHTNIYHHSARACSMNFILLGDLSLAPSGEIFYIQDPTAPPLSRGASSASWTNSKRGGSGYSKSSGEVGQVQAWRLSSVAGADEYFSYTK